MLVFGSKRFGDWIQMQMSKELYFYLQTDDILCKIYGILIGAPTCIPIYLLDGIGKINDEENLECKIPLMYYCCENPDIKFESQDYSRVISGNLTSETYDPLEHQIIHSTYFTTPDSRIFFSKFLKYKQKYLEQKNKLL